MIQSVSWNVYTMEAYQDIVRTAGPSAHCCVILAGRIRCYRMLVEGRRQILSFQVPGDLPDLQSRPLPVPPAGLPA